MKTNGKLISLTKSLSDNSYTAVLNIDDSSCHDLVGKEVSVEIKKRSRHRSNNANALMWECLDQIATYLNTDKWEVYLKMLKRYGSWTMVLIDEEAYPTMKELWRECEVIDRYKDGDRQKVELMCYYGSSTYNTIEFTKLVNGILSEMEQMGISLPDRNEVEQSIKAHEEMRKRKGFDVPAETQTEQTVKDCSDKEQKKLFVRGQRIKIEFQKMKK